MPDPDSDRRIVEFDGLNWLGKVVYVGGQLAHAVAWLVDAAVDKTSEIIGEAERALREAMDEEVEDAHILDEHDDRTG